MVSRIGEIGIQYGNDQVPDASTSDRERITSPDLAVPRMAAAQITRTRTKELTGCFAREQDVISKICSADNLDKDRLKSMRKANNDGRLLFAEYQNNRTGVSYLYVTPHYEVPVASTAYRWVQVDRKEPETPTLLRVGPKGTVTEIHRWDD